MKRTQFHRNLNTGAWSYIPPSSNTLSCSGAYLVDVDMRHPSTGNKAFLKCLSGGSRKVFAWFKAVQVNPQTPNYAPANAARIFFNPTKGDRAFHIIKANKKLIVDHAMEVYAMSDGTIYGRGFTFGGDLNE